MHRFMTIAGIALAVLALVAVAPVNAQVIQVYYPPAPVTYSYYAPPTTVYYPPAPVTYSYYAPPVSTVAYYPTTSYYPTTVYSPGVVYSSPGVVTTRSFVGLGIFRPRGVYTQSYYSPGYVSGYYAPAYFR